MPYRTHWTALPLGLAFALSGLIGCVDEAARPRMVMSPDGTAWWYDLSCHRMADCMEQARSVCKARPYDIMNSGSVGSESTTVAGRVGGAVIARSGSTEDLEVMIKCRHAPRDLSNDREILPPGTPAPPPEKEGD